MDKFLDIATDALFEIGVLGIDTPVPTAAQAQLCLRIANRELDAWAALRRFVFAFTFVEYTLTPNHQPHLIGPGPGLTAADFTVTQRPVRVEGANLVLNNVTPNVDLELTPRDRAWWNAQTVKPLATSVPTDLYYEPSWPNGALNLWPVPTFAYGLRLELWGLILQFAKITDEFSMPPAYRRAVVLTLAEKSCRSFGRPAMPDLIKDAAQARADLQTNNVSSPRIASADYGTQGSRGGRGSTFNYYSGMPGK